MKKFILARQSILIAWGLALALVLWFVSGQFGNSGPQETVAEARQPARTEMISVRVRAFQAEEVSGEVVVSGRTEANRAVTLRAEIDGRVVVVNRERGSRVQRGDGIVQLDLRDHEEALDEARATVKQRQLQYAATKKLYKQDYQPETVLAEARAKLEAARAQVKRMALALDNTRIRASFGGILDERPVEVGDYLGIGDPVARIIDTDPLLIAGDVTEQRVALLEAGGQGEARLATGQHVTGTLRYIAAESDDATRTFRVELEVLNPEGLLPAGITAELHLPARTTRAHYLSPGLLSLDESGEVGVKVVDETDQVVFYPARVVRSTAEGLYIEGLPDTVRVITVGQGYVRAGDRVRAVDEKSMRADDSADATDALAETS